MTCSDWIQMGLSIITLAGVLIALFQPRCQYLRNRKTDIDKIKSTISLYLDAFEAKAEVEKISIQRGRESLVKQGKFEEYNRINYRAIEETFLQARELPSLEYSELRKFVKFCKISKNMTDLIDIERFLRRIKKPELRAAFPRGDDLATEIDEATV